MGAFEASAAVARRLAESQAALAAAHEELATLRKAYVWQRCVAWGARLGQHRFIYETLREQAHMNCELTRH
jgi:hypothetical protein